MKHLAAITRALLAAVPLSLSVLAPLGCTAPEPTPEGATFTVYLPPALGTGPSTRLAVLWLEQAPARFVVSNDVRVRTGTIELRMDWPKDVRPDHLFPQETMLVAKDDYQVTAAKNYTEPMPVYAQVYRPRLVVYDDVDGDQALDLRESARDRVLATDNFSGGVAALLDPKAALEQMSLDQARAFYAANESFTRFLGVKDYGSQLYPLGEGSITLLDNSHGVARDEIACGRALNVGQQPLKSRFVAEQGIDAETSCPLEAKACESTSLNELPAPEYGESADEHRYAVCRENGTYAALAIFTESTECGNCSCNIQPWATVYFANLDAPPEWWPCGGELEYCDDGVSVAAPAWCTSDFVIPGFGAAADAGVSPDAGLGLVDDRGSR